LRRPPTPSALPTILASYLRSGDSRTVYGQRRDVEQWFMIATPARHLLQSAIKQSQDVAYVASSEGLINAIIRIKDCDVLIGICWKRFGTTAWPTS
jgi:hypothetical protein